MSDLDSTESDEMTAEAQNQSNAEADDVHSLLSNFMQAKEETLEDLVGGLMFLTMDEVRNSSKSALNLKQNSRNTTAQNVQSKGGTGEVSVSPEGRVTSPENLAGATETCSDGSMTCNNNNNNRGDTEDIEEEVLDDSVGSRQMDQDRLLRHRPTSLTKFDNFIVSTEEDCASDTESSPGREEVDDWLPSSGYQASFGSDNATARQELKTPSDAADNSQTPSNHKAGKDSSESNLPSSENMARLNSSTNESSPAENADNSNLSDSSKDVPDSETLDLQCDNCSRDCDTEVETPAWALNPGEVEDEEERSLPMVTQSISMMEFSTKVASPVDSNEAVELGSADDAQGCSDEVVPFALDEEFDYNTIVCTPKFSQVEMNYLTSFLPQNS